MYTQKRSGIGEKIDQDSNFNVKKITNKTFYAS